MGDMIGSKIAALTVAAIGIMLLVLIVAGLSADRTTRLPTHDTEWHPPMILECEEPNHEQPGHDHEACH